MKNMVSDGEKMPWLNSTGSAVVSGQLVCLGGIAGVASTDIANGETGTLALEGAFTVPKDSSLVITQGDALYYNGSTNKVFKTASTNVLVGYAFSSALSADTTVVCVLKM